MGPRGHQHSYWVRRVGGSTHVATQVGQECVSPRRFRLFLVPTGQMPIESLIAATRHFILRETCRVLRIELHLVGDQVLPA